jgi:predicted transcriptional regulator
MSPSVPIITGGFFMHLKDIESQIDQIVLDYIKNQCLEKQYVRTDIKEISKNEKGTTYRSSMIYKYVLNEGKYRMAVKEYYYNNIQPHQKESKKTTFREKGKNITQVEALQMIFRDFYETDTFKTVDSKNRIRHLKGFLFNIDAHLKVIDEQKAVSSLSKLLSSCKKYNYYTPSLFIHHKYFLKEFLAYMGVIVLDFDLDKTNVLMSKEDLRKYIIEKLKVEPNLIIDTKTKGNYQAYLLIDRMVGTPISVHLYEQIVQEMIYQLGEICDNSGDTANHIFSMPKNDKRTGRLTRKYHDKTFNINEFKWLLDERDKRRKKENPSKVIDFTEQKLFREPAIKALLNGEVSWRNHSAFTIALLYYSLNKPIEECQTFLLLEWLPKVNNDNFDHKITEREIQHCVKHAYSGKYAGPHSKWIQACTGIEFKYRIWKKYQPTGAYKMDTKQRLIDYLKNNNNIIVATQKELAQTLNVNDRTLRRYLDKLREAGELVYETNHAHNGKTTYTYIEKQKSQTVYDIERYSNYNEELLQIEQLEKEVSEIFITA